MKQTTTHETITDEIMSACNDSEQTNQEAILPAGDEQVRVQSERMRYAKQSEARFQEKQHQKYFYRILFRIMFVIIIGYGVLKGYGIMKTYGGKDMTIERFTEALEEKDLPELKKYIRVPDPAIRVNEKSLQPLFTYLDKNPDGYKKIRDELEMQDEKERVYIKGLTSEPPIFLMRVYENHYFLFNQYVFEPVVYSLIVHVQGKNVILYVNGKKVYKTESETFSGKIGSYIPGIYEITAVKKEGNETKKKRKEIVLFGGPKAQSVQFTFK
ncbi:hypothetical protein B0I26_11710 [Anoxybacillus vitaminiphilus]|uniref:TcaA second domain-containing protein n=1 Tax=Paranoxybacillus vitaminiphilus TaxID=581036 RepID=A0A327Y9D1_9BACL|nr:hypothetical protein [Anoxybacillus vitaminiphilus]RAK16596.1 hypothetical protein B0I26_11710 [Anoxybacillus vitaminiphilus]